MLELCLAVLIVGAALGLITVGLAGIARRCPRCGSEMKTTADEVAGAQPPVLEWVSWCPRCDEVRTRRGVSPLWAE